MDAAEAVVDLAVAEVAEVAHQEAVAVAALAEEEAEAVAVVVEAVPAAQEVALVLEPRSLSFLTSVLREFTFSRAKTMLLSPRT